jgi:peptide/nickel transport system ATP-binding protein
MMTDQTKTARPVLDIRNLEIAVAGGQRLVRDVSLSIPEGRVLALVGESGSGKTMIGRSVLRLLPDGIGITGGSVTFEGEDLARARPATLRAMRGARIGMVFQEPLVSLNPAIRIGEQMAEGLRLHMGLSAAEIRARSVEMLRRINIADPEGCLAAWPHQFSGGMRQRIMLASVMLLRPRLLIADEPTTALDSISQMQVMDTMMELVREAGTAVALITHNIGLVARYADDAVVLQDGGIVEQGSARQIIAAPRHPYTVSLIDSLPQPPERPRPVPRGDIVLEASALSVSYPGRIRGMRRTPSKPVVRDVSLRIRKGETVAVVGGSGTGKTTLGRAMLRLVDAQSGAVLHKSREITHLPDRQLRDFRRSCQIVFQDPFSSLDPRMKVGALVAEALRHKPGLSAEERRARVTTALDDVGLPGHDDRFPHELSGGQRQRVAIARAIVADPDLVVADEPISALDMRVQKQILGLFEELQERRGFACLFISHDLAAVRQIAHRIVVMHEGRIVEEGPCEEVFSNPRHEYTRLLTEAAPAIETPEDGR